MKLVNTHNPGSHPPDNLLRRKIKQVLDLLRGGVPLEFIS